MMSPVEPTPEMIEDGAYVLRMSTQAIRQGSSRTLARQIYCAMVDAALAKDRLSALPGSEK
jgi:hypothetical protein